MQLALLLLHQFHINNSAQTFAANVANTTVLSTVRSLKSALLLQGPYLWLVFLSRRRFNVIFLLELLSTQSFVL